jgi:signal recognition particle subunit SRP54
MKDFVEQIRMVRKMGPLKDLLEKFPLFGEMTEQLNPDESELTKIEAMYCSMTEKERLNPALINDSRVKRIAKGSGRKTEEVRELLGKFQMMQQVMGSIGANPGLLGRIPGFKQLGQLSKMKNMDLGSMLGGGGADARMMQQMMGGMGGGGGMGGMPLQLPQVAPGYTPPMGQAAMARARLMGYAPPGQVAKSEDRDAIKERRKREKANKKKNRKKK